MYQLSKEAYEMLKSIDLTEMAASIEFNDAEKTIRTDDVNLLLIIIHEEVATSGLSADQNTITSYGRKLYALYDELLAQKK